MAILSHNFIIHFSSTLDLHFFQTTSAWKLYSKSSFGFKDKHNTFFFKEKKYIKQMHFPELGKVESVKSSLKCLVCRGEVIYVHQIF